MSSLRRYVPGVVAVLMALALGIALGGGPLAGSSDRLAADRGPDSGPAAANGFGEAVISQGAERLYADGLQERSVAVISFPGVLESTRQAVTTQVAAAGGEVVASYLVRPALVDPGQKTLVESLGGQLLTQLEEPPEDAEAAVPYDRMGQLIALAAGPTGAEGADADTVVQALAKAGLVEAADSPDGAASYVVVILGEDTGAQDDPIYGGLVAGLATGFEAAVVAATAFDGRDGRLSRLRQEPVGGDVATVDSIETPAGQVTAVLALTEWPETKGREFGASGADGAVGLG